MSEIGVERRFLISYILGVFWLVLTRNLAEIDLKLEDLPFLGSEMLDPKMSPKFADIAEIADNLSRSCCISPAPSLRSAPGPPPPKGPPLEVVLSVWVGCWCWVLGCLFSFDFSIN